MKTWMFFILLSTSAFAQNSRVNIKNFNFSYQAPQGSGTADHFSYNKLSSQKVNVEKVGEDFKIILDGVENRELEFKNAPEIIQNAHTINLKAFNLNFDDRASLGLTSGAFISIDESLSLKNVQLICNRSANEDELSDQVIVGCIDAMALKVESFTSSGSQGLDEALMRALDSEHFLGSMGVQDVELKVNSGNFNLQANVSAQLSGKAKAKGTASYDPNAKKLTIKILEVKFGILNVTTKVFEELKKQESEKIQVNRPYIYISLK